MSPSLEPLLSSTRDDWRTPREVLERVRRVNRIALDPCSGPGSLVGARVNFTTRGLERSWWAIAAGARGLVYLNPPYSEVKHWVAKAAAEHLEDGVEVLGLVVARPDTQWFRRHVIGSAAALCFWEGRITFVGAKHPAPFPSVVPYWGHQVDRFVAAFEDAGWIARRGGGEFRL